MRLIDADKLKSSLNETVDAAIKWHEDCLGEIAQNRSEAAITTFIECILRVKEQPTVDAVEVIRCKDCKHFETCSWSEHEDEGFCKWVERSEDNG